MFRQLNFKSYFTFLSRNKLYTAINLLGLALSLAFVLIIAAYTLRQMNTDAAQQNADRIYCVGNTEDINNGYYLSKHLMERYPEIETATAIAGEQLEVELGNNHTRLGAKVMFADSSFLRIFSFPLVEGSRDDAFATRESAIVSRSFAQKMFGQVSPLGQAVKFVSYGQYSYVITGVMDDIDNSVLKPFDIMVRADVVMPYNNANDERMSNSGAATTFVLTRKGSDFASKADDMLSWFKTFYWIYEGGLRTDVVLYPLRDLYFADVEREESFNSGDSRFVRILFLVSFVLLFFALINYINLTVAQTGFRAKEMATRRLLGTSKGTIILKMILESTFMSFVAAVFAVAIAEALTPAAVELIGYRFSIWDVMTPQFIAVCAGVVLLLGLFSGIIPALTISRFKPIDVVKGTFRTRSKMVYSKVLIVVQNVITIAMIAAALTISLQLRHLIAMPLGYNTADIVTIDNFYGMFADGQQMARFRDELRKSPLVESVGFGDGIPLRGTNNNTMSRFDQKPVSFQLIQGDSAYFDILGLRVKTDNHLATREWYVNEFALREMGLPDDAESFTVGQDGDEGWSHTYTIGGVYYDFRLFHTYRDQSAALIHNRGEYNFEKSFPWTTVIKVHGEKGAVIDAIRTAYEAACPEGRYNGDRVTYVSDAIERLFASEKRLQSIVDIFTFIAVLISALGLFAMSTYYIQQKRQEIAVRKVFGSTREDVLGRLVGSFMRLVGVAFVVACPLVYYIMQGWLEGYSYRIALSWWILAVAGLFAVTVAFLTVLYQSLRAARENPIEAIK